MAQEVQQIEPSAVWRDRDGYLMVNYDRIGLKFMTWKEWLARNGASSCHEAGDALDPPRQMVGLRYRSKAEQPVKRTQF